ncbi:MAG: hypothetical protein M1829_004015 [Trizodia sp. TS-e1964]|nr:MAG: hypothetical protein M1829_004015 [Trizodia sp. TS-e1964]
MMSTSTFPNSAVGPTSQLHMYAANQGHAISTPFNSSPTSPDDPDFRFHHLPLQSRQLRAPKSPLYRPAVLRPFERPLRMTAPLTPPRSLNNSFDSIGNLIGDKREAGAAGEPVGGQKYSAFNIVEMGGWLEEGYGKVNGAPMRDHWKPDASTSFCTSPSCSKAFTLFERRHHCRRCGNIYCAEHSGYLAKLDHLARFHPDGVYGRACDACWGEYKEWETQRCVRISGQHSRPASPRDDDSTSTTTPTKALGIVGASEAGAGGIGIPESAGSGSSGGGSGGGGFAASVPRDWNWSTF